MSKTFRLLVSSFFVSACALALPAVAHAQETKDKDCPPGSWFCGETQPPPAGANKNLEPLPDAKPAETKPAETKPAEARPAPPVVVYQPAPATVVVRERPRAYVYVPRQPPPRKREWGFNLHGGGLLLGGGRDDNAGMGLVGFGFRFRPNPHFALEADLDFAGGRDYNGYRRAETAFGVNGIFFLNPQHRTQVYLLGGVGWSVANATDDRSSNYYERDYRYGYFGAQAGAGLEFRLSKVVALNVDVRGLIRGRVDSRRDEYPEFVRSDGRYTNTSGAGLIQGGITFYW